MIRQLCLLLVTKLDAAAPGGASSNRRRGVDGHGPRRSAQPPFQPRVIPHPIGRALERAPGLLGSRERERGGGSPRSRVVLAQGFGCRDSTAMQSRIFTTTSSSHYLSLPSVLSSDTTDFCQSSLQPQHQMIQIGDTSIFSGSIWKELCHPCSLNMPWSL